ncbi:MAG: IPT/TIG domain-containing protein, partial [Bacteroidota bacterium]
MCTILYSIYSFIPPGNSPQNSLPPSGEIVFFDDFETPSFGPMWSNSSSTSDGLIRIGESIEGIATPQAGTGAVIMGKTTDGAFNINSLDLALSLAAYQGQQLYLSFFIRHYWEERDDNDGLYFSDDGGQSFVKVLDFAFDEWTPNAYGQLPPIDMTALSKRYNLNFTNDFIVRFQQADNADFNNSGDEDGLLLDNVLIREESVGYASLPFQEDFESGTLSDNWTWATPLNTISSPSYIRPGGRLTIDSSDFAAAEGSRGLLMGRWVDGAYTVNAIDLHLDLAAQQTAYLQFNVMDFVDETDPEDGLYFSDDGGENFQKVLRFDNGDWTDAYGLHAPIPIHRLASRHGLQLSERFVIRFQQGGSGDFNYSGAEDGLLLDNVRVYSQSPSYASLPYNDGFEGSLSSSWQWNLSDQTSPAFCLDNGGWMQPVNWPNIAFEGTQALAMGRTFDGTYSCVAADLHLDLDNYAEVQLQFQFRPFYDESEDVDALYFSDDGGENFTKVARLNPASLPVDQYSLLQFDIDSLAALYQLNLSSRFVIRFQQGGSGDFNFSGAEDGFLIDQLQVSGQLNADGPSLDGFAPAQGRIRDRIELQGKKFSTDCQVFFNGQAAEEVQFIDEQRLEAVIPPLATSGRIKVQNALGQDISNEDFSVLDRQIIFFEDFESATLRSMWTANSSATTGFVSVDQAFGGIIAPFEGLYGAILGQTADGELNINTLDLAIPLAAHQDSELALSFYIKHFNEEYEADDGLYLSDDGGQNFVKVADFRFDGWTNNAYGQLPPFDLDQLAMDNGLILNDDFIIRFQHSSNADFNFSGDEDGLFLDNILLREEVTPYLRLPFEDGFETNTLLPAWTWSRPLNTISSPDFIRPGGTATISASDFAAANGLNGLFLGRNYDGGYTVNALDLHLDLSGETAVYLQFSIRDFVDETNPEDGLYFSDDGGVSFRKVWRFNTGDWTDGYGLIPPLPVHRLAAQNGLALSNQFVIRFQQAGSGDLNFSGDEDGILLDDVRVFSQPPVYASLPFTDGFENGLGSAWQWTLSDQTSPFSQLDNGGFVTEVDWQGFVFEGEKALAMGRAFDGTATTLAADLHLNLENYAQANLQFQFLPFYEEDDNTDGIWFSDDGGAHFTKVVQLLPASLSPTNYTPIQVDIDSLAALNALKLTDQFVIRFQQTGLGDFNFSGAEDGFLIDQVSVTGQLNTNGPSLVDFEPGSGEIGDRIELTGRNFTADTKVFFNGQAAKEVQFVSTQKLEVVVPALATSGRIRVRNDLGQDLSATDFQLIGQQVIFFEDFETAQLRSMWTANSSTEEGLVEVNQTGNGIIAAYEGLYGAVLGKTQDGQFNVNTLDLAIPLGAFQGKNLIFSFYLKSFQEEYQAEDGVYLSDDGGQTFTKVIDLRYDLWTGSQFGQLPPYDLDELASRNNLVLNDDFVIRFQQAGNGDFNFSGAEDGLFLDNILIQEQTITHAPLPFEEGFESGVLGPAWKWGHPLNTIGSPDYIRPGGRLAIGSSSFIAYNGLNGLTMGRYYDGNYTVNALDLHLDLAGESDVYLQYWINDFEDELDPEDGLYFSDDGGQSFHKVWQFNYGDWTLGYGHIPPIPVHRLAQRFGLQLNDRFVIRFQQAGVGDYNYSGSEDGLLIDDIRVYAQEKEYATLPFVDNFENGLSSFWQWNTNDQTAPLNSIDNGSFLGIVEDPNFAFEGQGYLTFGRIFDGSYTSIAADLHLQLEDFSAVDLQFQYRPYFEEQNEEDGIWASDDGGQHFTKIYQFQPQLFPPNAYSPIQLAIDSLADLYGLRLSNAFILRFQQAGTGDFNTSGSEDGMLIDQLSVTGVANTAGPRITSFTPSEGWPGTRVSILGERLTNDTEVFFNGVAAADVRFVNAQRLEAIVPAAASSGRIKVSNDLGEDVSASDFKVLGREVIFFEDFETGQLRSMWTANSSTDQGLVEVVQRAQSVTYAASEGWYAAALGKTVDGQLNANTLDLSIPLAIYQGRDLQLSFFIRHFYEEYQPEDGVYFSDDGGRTFTKVIDLRTDQWVNDRYGQLPPFDLDELAARNGLRLTDDFIIRFQQSDNGDFNFSGDEDGILLDNILIKEVRPTYAQLPFEDSFESGELSDNWQWSRADSTAGLADYIRPSGQVTVAPLAAAARTGFHGLLMGNRYDGLFTVNALDLLLDLSGQREVVLSFWLYDFYDETQEQDGLYFSSDGGKNFRKIYDLDPSSYPNLQYQQFELGLDSLVLQAGMSFSANSVLRFQQGDFGDFNTSGSEDGWFLDDVQVSGQQDGQSPQITYFEPARGQVDDLIILKGFHLNGTNRVSFAGANANNLLVVDDNTVRVRVPDGAQSGPITLETPNGVAQSPYDFILAQGFDLGPVQLVEPLSECARNESVPVRVVVRNFGEEEVQSFRLGYQVNGGPAVVETISKSIEPGEEYEHTFNQTFSLASSGNFTVELFTELAQDENPSNNRISRNVLISSSPMATASASDSDICPGTITVLTASGGTSYLWNTGAIAANISVAPEETTDYSVTVTNEEGCSNVASVRVNVLPTPTPEISTPDGTVLCGGDSIRLISNLSDNIIWSDNRTFDPELIVTRPGFYRLRYFGDNGCSSESEWIQVELSRPLSISSSGSGIICQGDSETLSVSNAVESIWSTGAMSNSITVSPLEETSYSVTATNNLGCTYVDSVVIRVIPSDALEAGDQEKATGRRIISAPSSGSMLLTTPGTSLGITRMTTEST